MKMIKGFAVGLLLLLGVQGAAAQLHSQDSSFGANSIVFDERTGLSWLQLPYSTGLTSADWNRVYDSESWTFQSGLYEGYRLADQVEVDVLVLAYIACPTPSGPCETIRWSDAPLLQPTGPGVVDRALDVIRLFGGEITTASDGSQRGVMSGNVLWGRYPSAFGANGWNTGIFTSSGPLGNFFGVDHFARPNGMTYLIAPIPEPSTYALMLAGLAAVGFVARRRKAAAVSV